MTDLLSDDELLERLRTLAAVHDPVPASVLANAKAAFMTRTLEDELADLLFDSLVDDALVGMRGTVARQLTFGVGDVAIDLDLDDDGLVGLVSPAAVLPVELQTLEGSEVTETDELGRFFLSRPAGPFRLRVGVDGRHVTTEWVHL